MVNAFAEECLKAHNEYRRKHGAQPLSLDEKICNVAQRWANNIAARNMMQHSTGTGYGENIYASCGQKVNGRMPAEAWYSEIKYYKYGSGFSMKTGCVEGQSKDGRGLCHVVANYYPPGNYANQFSANVLPPGNYFQDEPKKEAKGDVAKTEKKENSTPTPSLPKSQSNEASIQEISDDILAQIEEQDLSKAQRFCDFICGYLSARYNQYTWIATLANGSPEATYRSGPIFQDYNYVIETGGNQKTIINIFQFEKNSAGKNVVNELKKLDIA